MRSTLLAIGDIMMDEVRKAPSLSKFMRYRKRLMRRNIKFEFCTYDDVLLGRLPDVFTRRLKIMLFFPFTYWNSKIERYDIDERIYGDENFGRDYKKIFLRVEKIIKERYKDKEISYVNPPQVCILDRDKKRAAQILKRNGILIPKIHHISNIAQFNKVLDKVGPLYVKPVFGAMGKGISFVTKKECWTNFIFRGNKIRCYPYDYDWEFMKVSKKRRDAFLKILIKKGFIFEEAIKLPMVKRRKFDIRIYVIYGKIPYLYARSNLGKRLVTNWSQGGRIERLSFLKRTVPENKIVQIKELAKRACKTIGLNYAGVDIMLEGESDNIYFSEVHSFPAYERGFNLMKFLIDRI